MADQDLKINVVTTADTTGIQKTREELERLRQDAGAKKLFAQVPPEGKPKVPEKEAESAGEELAGHIGKGFERVALHAIGIGAVLEAINAIKQVAEEINKITDALDKQGEALVKNSREMLQQARFAQTDADIQKTAEEGMKNIVEQHKIVDDLWKKELTTAEKIADEIAKQMLATQGFPNPAGPNQARLDAERAAAQANESTARATAISALDLAMKEKQRLETESMAEAVAELTGKMEDQEKLREEAYARGDVQGFLEATKAAQAYKKEISDVIKLEEQRIAAANKAAAPLAKALTTPTGQFISEQQRAEAEHQAKRAALEQKRREAVYTGDTEGAKAIEDELSHDRFARDQRKEQLQRYVANQESLFRQVPGIETQSDMLKDLGTEGLRKYEAAQAELGDIYTQQIGERKAAAGGGGDKDVAMWLQKLYQLWQ